MEIVNTGNTPTFIGARGQSIIDHTLCTHDIATRIADWCVEEGEATLFDHRLISYSLRMPRPKKDMRRYLKKLDVDKFKARVDELCESWGPVK